MRRLKITLKRSPIGHDETQKRTVRALGLRRLHQTVYQSDNPSIRGMIARIPHLLHVELEGEAPAEPKLRRMANSEGRREGGAPAEPKSRRLEGKPPAEPIEQEEASS